MQKHAVILSCEGLELTEWEKSFFSQTNPFGIILFSRNIKTPDQVKALTDEIKTMTHSDMMILIDQEGGRVQRLKPPYWRNFPAMAHFGELYQKNEEAAKQALYLTAHLMGDELAQSGFTIDCAPVLDLFFPNTSSVIGDRAFSSDPETVSVLAKCFCQGLMEQGVLPVIKHMPGHGRARKDSHFALPHIDTPLSELEKTDFIPFRNLNKNLMGMTAHIVYQAFDADNPMTLSKTGIEQGIRGVLDFQGLLMTDDIAMEALSGSFAERTQKAFLAGCDLVMYCQGVAEEMEEVVKASPVLSGLSLERTDKVLSFFKALDGSRTLLAADVQEKQENLKQIFSDNQVKLNL